MWSVGPSDVEPQERWAIVAPEGGRTRLAWWNSPPPEVQLDAAPTSAAQHVYLLVPRGLYTPDRNPILLPLPTVEAPDDEGNGSDE